MVKINYCPSCGAELGDKSFVCPKCCLDIEELFAKGYLLASNIENKSIELFKGNEEIICFDEGGNPGDELVIVVPKEESSDGIVIDFDELGIDIEDLGDNVNIVIEVDDAELLDEKEYIPQPNQWFFDDDPYGIVYYEFVSDDD